MLLDAQMSVPYTAALAVLYGDVTAQMFLPETMERPEVDALVQRVDAYVDDECERMYPAKRSAVYESSSKTGASSRSGSSIPRVISTTRCLMMIWRANSEAIASR